MRGLEKKSLMNRNKEAVYKKKGLETPTIKLHKSIFIRNEIIKSSQSHPTWDSILNVSLEHSFEIRWQFFPQIQLFPADALIEETMQRRSHLCGGNSDNFVDEDMGFR